MELIWSEDLQILKLNQWLQTALLNSERATWQTTTEELFMCFENTHIERAKAISHVSEFHLREFQNAIRGPRLIHDIVPDISRTECDKYLKRCLSKKFQGGMFIYVGHTDHVHAIHDCNWAGYCRCHRIATIPIKRELRKFGRIHVIHERYINNITKYFVQHPRLVLRFELAGQHRLPPNQIGNLLYEEIEECAEKRVVEGSHDSLGLSDNEPCGSSLP